MAEDIARMESDFSNLLSQFSLLHPTLDSLTESVKANGTVPISVQAVLRETKESLDKADDTASRVLSKLPEIKPLQVSIGSLTKDLQLAKAELAEKTKLHTDEMQKQQNSAAELERRRKAETDALKQRVQDTTSDVKRLQNVEAEAKRLRNVDTEVKRLQNVESKLKRLQRFEAENVKLGTEISNSKSANRQLEETVARQEGAIKSLNRKIVEINNKHNGTKTQLEAAARVLTAKTTELETQLQNAATQLGEKSTELADTKTQLQNVATELGEKTTDLAETKTQYEAAVKRLKEQYDADLTKMERQYFAAIDEERDAVAEEQERTRQCDRTSSIWRLKYENLKGTISAEKGHLNSEFETKAVNMERAMKAEAQQLAIEKQELVKDRAALESRVQVYEWYIPHLKKQLDENNRTIAEALRRDLAEAHGNELSALKKDQEAALVQQKASLMDAHGAALRQARTEHEKKEEDLATQMTNLKREHEATIARQKASLNDAHATALQQARTEHESREHDSAMQIKNLKREHEVSLARQKTSSDDAHAAALQQARTEHENKEKDLILQIANLKREHVTVVAQQKASLDDAHGIALHQVRAEHEKNQKDLVSQVTSLKGNLEATLTRCKALEEKSEKDSQSLQDTFLRSDSLSTLQQQNIADRDARIVELTTENTKLHLDLPTIKKQKDAELQALKAKHADVLARHTAETTDLKAEYARLLQRKNDYKGLFEMYEDKFGPVERYLNTTTPTPVGDQSIPLPEGAGIVPRLEDSQQIVTTRPSGRKRLRDDVEDEPELHTPKKVLTAQVVIDAEEEDGFQHAGDDSPVPEEARQDQEVAFMDNADVVLTEQDLETRIWSMFILPGDLEGYEKDVLLSQVQVLCEKKQNVFEDVVAAIDHHVVGRFDQAPPEPRPCFMAQVMGQAAGMGGSRMTRKSCAYCKKKPDERICCWARHVNGVGSGYLPRVDGKISGSSKDWNTVLAEPLTIESNGRSVRWQLIRRKARAMDPDY